jgi:hypothetical protein
MPRVKHGRYVLVRPATDARARHAFAADGVGQLSGGFLRELSPPSQ